MAGKKTYLYPWFGALALAVVTAGIGYTISHSSPPVKAPILPAESALTAAAVFSEAPTQRELAQTLQLLIDESAQPQKNPQTEKSVQVLVSHLTEQDYQLLHTKVLDANLKMAERQAVLFVLTQSESSLAQKALIELAETALPEYSDLQDPHSVGSQARTLEMSLRVTALESLDQRGGQSSEIAKGLLRILQKQNEPSLRFLAQTSLSGIEAGKPGRLKRIIDEMLGSPKQ